jgi:hypothetical protein
MACFLGGGRNSGVNYRTSTRRCGHRSYERRGAKWRWLKGKHKTVSGAENPQELLALRALVETLHERIASVEARAQNAEHEAHLAHEEVLRLRDQLAAAQRDQQDLKTTRARLARVQVRGLLARILNRY